MDVEHRTGGKRKWYRTEEERAREMIRRTYGPDLEEWALGQLRAGHVLEVQEGQLRQADEAE